VVHVDCVRRDNYAGRLGDADLEELLLRNVDTEHFQSVSKSAPARLATMTLNLEMLIERHAHA
jgi:hypothetical protein